MRGFKVCKGYENNTITMPQRKTTFSAGYDISIIEEILIEPKQIILAKTGVKAFMESDEVLLLYIRSSLASKKGIMLANHVGVIDSDYYENIDNDGHIMCALYNASDVSVTLKKGERICQGIFTKYLITFNDEISAVRSGGFGSTNKDK